MSIPGRYDAINAVLFLGRSRRLRQQLVSTLEIRRGDRVLELGCGSGQVTERLVAAGADVTAVDALPEMLARAVARAPQATFIEGDLTDLGIDGPFDRVVLSFVLHNFDAGGRRLVLDQSAARLSSGGAIGILDWALPPGRTRSMLWRRFLHRLEPSPSVEEILGGSLAADIRSAGLRLSCQRPVASGRAQILVATGPT
jgi:ubiquinone/menaquinone biosynthesis C-methylase UbiE